MCECAQGTNVTYGEFPRDKFSGDLFTQWLAVLRASASALQSVDVSSGVALVLASKDATELDLMRRAASVTSKLYNAFLKEQIIKIIDDDRVCTTCVGVPIPLLCLYIPRTTSPILLPSFLHSFHIHKYLVGP